MKTNQVKIISAPISERYWHQGDTGTIGRSGKTICVNGCWFDFDNRWIVKDYHPEPLPPFKGIIDSLKK